MARGQTLLEILRGAAGPEDPRADADLLERFAANGDADAFAALLRRHGTLVWGVCRRVLRHEQDAEDAFQATFLVLARSAGSVRRRGSVRCWLYGVAVRTALRARARAARRDDSPPPDVPSSYHVPESTLQRNELTEALDGEIRRLPERYRLPMVLCYLLGRTNDEAARELGCPRGTVAVRLARARERLRRRLLRRGFGPAVALPILPRVTAVSRELIESTQRLAALPIGAIFKTSACSLALGVLSNMHIYKWKSFAAAALALALLAATGAGTRALFARQPSTPVAVAAAPEPEKTAPTRTNEHELKIRKMLEDRQAAAALEFKERNEQFWNGRGELGLTLQASQRLLRSELALCRTKERRLKAREDDLARLKKIFEINQARFNAGRASVSDLEMSRYFLLDAQIEFERERAP